MSTIKTNTKEDQLRQAFAGGLSGALTRFLSQPLYGIAQFWTTILEQIDFLASQISLFRDRTRLRNFMSGAMARSTASIVSTPFDVVRTRLIAQDFTNGYRNAKQTIGQIVRTEGLRGLYRGVPSMIQVSPLMGSNFKFYRFFYDSTCQVWNVNSTIK